MSDADTQALAEAVRDAMYGRDDASRGLGIQVDAISPGCSRCSMIVRQDMINGHNSCHGGFIFTLADSAFAFACNAGNRATVALAAHITFIAPARLGDVLIATASEESRTRRTGVYDVEIATDDGRDIALFRGNSYETKNSVI